MSARRTTRPLGADPLARPPSRDGGADPRASCGATRPAASGHAREAAVRQSVHNLWITAAAALGALAQRLRATPGAGCGYLRLNAATRSAGRRQAPPMRGQRTRPSRPGRTLPTDPPAGRLAAAARAGHRRQPRLWFASADGPARRSRSGVCGCRGHAKKNSKKVQKGGCHKRGTRLERVSEQLYGDESCSRRSNMNC